MRPQDLVAFLAIDAIRSGLKMIIIDSVGMIVGPQNSVAFLVIKAVRVSPKAIIKNYLSGVFYSEWP